MGHPLHFAAIAFAGGGLRCYWQSGFMMALRQAEMPPPGVIIGVSAGAYHACLAMAGKTETTMPEIVAWYENAPDHRPRWRNLLRGETPFAVGRLYREALAGIFDDDALGKLRAAPPVLIQLSRPPRFVPSSLAALAAIGAYQLEKRLTGAAYSQAGRYVGFAAEWISTHDVATPDELVDALMATASVPPFMPVGQIRGRPALDGGLVDNPPIGRLAAIETAGGRTLVLATRFGEQMASTAQRLIIGPSEPVTVGKFICHSGEEIRRTIALGRKDGEAFVAQMMAR